MRTAGRDAASDRVVDHLVELGHRRISHLSGGGGNRSQHDRKAGYVRAMKRHGLVGRASTSSTATSPSTLRHARRTGAAAPTTTPDRGLCRQRSERDRTPRPAASARGIDVPGDIAVAGYDDSMLARLAHIDSDHRQPGTAPASRASQCERSSERLDENRQERLDVLLEPRLVIRAHHRAAGPAAGLSAATASGLAVSARISRRPMSRRNSCPTGTRQ